MATRKTSKKTAAAKTDGLANETGHGAEKGAMSKADFVRAHRDLSPKEIVAQAKAEGISLAETYVYNVRGADKKARSSKRKRRADSSASTARNGIALRRPVSTRGSAENLLRAVACEIGFVRAAEIIAEERARVRDVIGH